LRRIDRPYNQIHEKASDPSGGRSRGNSENGGAVASVLDLFSPPVALVPRDTRGRDAASRPGRGGRQLSLLVHLVRRAGQRPSIRVEMWDGVPAAASEVADDLAALGCIRDDQAMVLYRSFRGPA